MPAPSPSIDRRIFELLLEQENSHFTVRGIRDQYAERYGIAKNDRAKLRSFLYEGINKLLRVGAVQQDEQKRKRDQVYHVLPTIHDTPINWDGERFEAWHKRQKSSSKQKALSVITATDLISNEEDSKENDDIHESRNLALEKELLETQSEFLSAMGETEKFRHLMTQYPDLRSSFDSDHREAYERSARLLGSVRALEKSLQRLRGT
ncbi:hypothetical protein OR573_07075 [Halomonas sp. CH40]